MQLIYHVRRLRYDNPSDLRTFVAGVRRMFYGQQAGVKSDEDYTWSLRDVYEPKFADAFAGTVYIETTHTAIVEGAADLEEVQVDEFEKVNFYFFLDVMTVLFARPDPATRVTPPSQLRDIAQELLLRNIRNAGLPVPLVEVPSGERSKSWFVKKLLEVAASDTQRIVNIQITALHGSSLSDELQLFNPDYTKEEIGRLFMPDALTEVQTSTHIATKTGDLSHNPMVRAQLGAGIPKYMSIKSKVDPLGSKEEKAQYSAEVTDKMTLRGAAKLTLTELMRRMKTALATRAYDND